MKKIIIILCTILAIVSCGTQKSAEGSSTTGLSKNDPTAAKERLEYAQKVSNNAVNVKNIVAKIDFSIDAMGHEITVDGKIQMRRDEVIRIVLSPFGLMEVGRLEFTPEGVLLIDRINKEYVNASYNDLDFLRSNGLDFYSLQSLFWNEMFMPGQKSVNDAALKTFTVEDAELSNRNISHTTGKLDFTWITSVKENIITKTMVEYGKGTKEASRATWTYDGFKVLNGKKFPSDHALKFLSTQTSGEMKLNINMGKISTDGDWDARTEISGKYTKVSAEQVLKKLTSL